jgi:small conductance mechanosensitive channel
MIAGALRGLMVPANGAALSLAPWFSVPRRIDRSDLSYLAWLEEVIQEVVVIVVIAVVLAFLLRLATQRLVRFSKSGEIHSPVRAQQMRTLASVIYSVGIAIICFIALLQILPVFGVNMGPLLASAGIAGLAIGFGAQTLVHDVINGFFILVENQYNVGDTVKIAGVKGAVEAMTLRHTVLRDADGTLHTVPNSQITVVSNLTRDWAQVTLHVATAYTENTDRVLKVLREVGAEIRNDPDFADMIVAEPEVPGIERVASGEVDYLMVVKTLPGTPQYAVSRELRRRVKECFEKNGIKPPGPAQVYVVDSEERNH